MKKASDVFKSIRFAKEEPRGKPHLSTDDEEHGAVGEKEFNQQVQHVKKRAMQEEKKDKYDEGEYDQEGDMAKSDLRSIIANAQKLHDMIDDADNLPEWVQSKITVAEDYMSTVANYMTAEMSEAVKIPKTAHQRFKERMKKAGYDMDAGAKRLQDLLDRQKKEREENEKNMKEETELNEAKKKPNATTRHLRQYPVSDKDVAKPVKKKEEKKVAEETEYLEEKNKPTNPELWSRAVSMARSKFDVYPCVPLDSMAISRKGPISHDELEIGEEILTYNMTKDILEWQPVLYKHYYEDAPLLEIGKPTGFSIRCTENHKWVISKDGGNELVETRNLNTHMRILMCSTLENDSSLLIENWSKKDNWIEKILSMNRMEREIFLASSIVYDGWDKGCSTKIKGRHTFGFVQKEYDHLWASLLAAYLNGYYVNSRDKSEDMTSATYIRNKKFHNTQNLYKKEVGNEDVWCPTTKNETWVMIQNGLITITGNSAYANGWAAKWYKSKGGGWKSVSEAKENPPFDPPYKTMKKDVVDKSGAVHGPMSIAKHLAKTAAQKQATAKKPLKESRKAEIVKEIVKKKKDEKAKDKFEANPTLSSEVMKD